MNTYPVLVHVVFQIAIFVGSLVLNEDSVITITDTGKCAVAREGGGIVLVSSGVLGLLGG